MTMMGCAIGCLCALTSVAAEAQNAAAPRGRTRVFSGSVPYTVRLDDDKTVQAARKRVQDILSLSADAVRAMVPTASGGVYFTDCPNCSHGTQDRGRFRWSAEEPGRLTCLGCGQTYPGNAKYPDDAFVEVAAPGGMHRFHYYERADGKRYFFRAHADWWTKDYLERQARDLAEIYYATGDETCARRAADILIRFAEVYPGYALIFDYPHQPKRFAPWTENHIAGTSPYRTSKWSWWAIMDISVPLTAAYDAIKGWDGLARMAGGRAVPMIEQDLLGGMVRFNLGVPNWEKSGHQPRVHKLLAARVLQRPEWAHEAVRRYSRIEQVFLHDGGYQTPSPSYMLQLLGTLRAWNKAAAGYSDPPGFVDPVDGRRFDNLDLARLYPFHDALERALLVTRFPDGRLLSVNDTWSINKFGGPRTATEPVLMPGMGVAVLGGGAGDDQLHAYLNFTDGAFHKQRDALSIGLFAHGRELLSDIGYTHTRYRTVWAGNSMSHNTVVVDGRAATAGHGEHLGSRLRAYCGDDAGFQLASAENIHAYAGVAPVFRRTLVKVGRDSRDGYLLDVFRVIGGRQHDYLLHGSADEDATAKLAGATLTPFTGTLMNPGMTFAEPEGEASGNPDTGYALIRDLRRAEAVGAVALDIRLNDEPAVGTRTLLTAVGAKVDAYLGRSPSVRRAKASDARLNDYFMPTFVARRRGDGVPLETVFAAAHEPINGAPRLMSLEARRQGGGLLLTVRHADGRADYFVMALEASSGPVVFDTSDGRLALDGTWGLVRLSGGVVAEAHLVGGESLALGAYQLKGPRGWSGEVRAVTRRRTGDSGGWFDVDQAPVAPHGALVITFADGSMRPFNVERIEPLPGGARVHVCEDPGIEVGEDHVRSVTFPQRAITGATIRWRLSGAAHWRAPAVDR